MVKLFNYLNKRKIDPTEFENMIKVVLASASPRRAHLFRQIGIDFSIQPSGFDESEVEKLEPMELASTLAKRKASSVAAWSNDSLVIAADTIVTIEGDLLGKPKGPREAFHMLRKLSGRCHTVITGVCIQKTDYKSNISDTLEFTENTEVTFSELSDIEIEHYIKSSQPFDKAGSYGIQDDMGSLFVEKIEGDYYNVVGFPLNRFYRELKAQLPSIHQQLFIN